MASSLDSSIASTIKTTNKSIVVDEDDEYPEFGYEMKEKEFYLDRSVIFLNHGSFGATPKRIMCALRNYQEQMESQPVRWFTKTLREKMTEVRKELASFIGASDENDIVWIDNASAGVNAVLRSIPFRNGETILHTNIAYGMVKKTVQYLKDTFSVNVVEVNIAFPPTESKIIEVVKEALDSTNVKLAIFSHISSTPSLILPVEQLVKLCKARNVLVLIDGAHSVGQIPLNLSELNADFYLSNAHKWLFSPKGSAFLWINKSYQKEIHPTVISFGYKISYQQEFEWVGTKDMCTYLAVSNSLNMIKRLSFEKIQAYQHELAVWTGEMLVQKWNTSLLVPFSMCAAMVNVRIPGDNDIEAESLHDKLLEQFNVEVPIFEFQGALYVRVSCQIYNTKEDMFKLADAILHLRNCSPMTNVADDAK